jgi:hypothetical protein
MIKIIANLLIITYWSHNQVIVVNKDNAPFIEGEQRKSG